jgi:predicted dehydrogenase
MKTLKKSYSAGVVGLGSMGKRRIRCLLALGVNKIIGVDIREDRRLESELIYGINAVKTLEDMWSLGAPDFIIISVPPLSHVEIMSECIKYKTPFFVEASVVDDGLKEVAILVSKKGILAAPSTTLRFHPAITEIAKIVQTKRLGKLSNILLHSGQFLPDWHPYEHVKDYYVSNPLTGGAREIVPFELTWFTEIFGFPNEVVSQYRKTTDIEGAENIDDTYNCLLGYDDFLASITVDVVSRYATRRLLINGDMGQLIWSWDDDSIKLYDVKKGGWDEVKYDPGEAALGYNKNISEKMYIDEISAFINAVGGGESFPNNLTNDMKVLEVLYALERSCKTKKFQKLSHI